VEETLIDVGHEVACIAVSIGFGHVGAGSRFATKGRVCGC
jgi:hypothetical protein